MEENKHNLPEENFPQPEEMLPEEQPFFTELTCSSCLRSLRKNPRPTKNLLRKNCFLQCSSC